ncbi:beta-galactosidase 3 [Streptococcus pneumoniae]|nr:beta-galactosidase 3 [Streptococcus pneumoniae]
MIQWWQILLLTLYSAYQICDELTIVSSAGSPVFAGFITGLIMGDVTTGLLIGGNLQLFVLGVGTFGGASRIDATSGAVLATAFSVSQGIDAPLAITTIAVPVAALLTYFDVLGRMTTTFFAHRVDAAIERFDYKGIERNYLLGAIPWALSRALPVFFALAFGGAFVQSVVDFVEAYKWVADGLTLNRWKEPIITRDPKELADAVREVLEQGSINLYMFHGGTNFGFMNGCSARGTLDLPQVTSYDYDALLDEEGNPTAKYLAVKKMMATHFSEYPQLEPLYKESMELDAIPLVEKVSLFETLDSLSSPVESLYPQKMEELGQSYGYLLYRTETNWDAEEERLRIIDGRDRAQLYVDGQWVKTQYQTEIGEDIFYQGKKKGLSRLDILIENMGRVNYGHKFLADTQRKGIRTGVCKDLHFLLNWKHYPLPLDNPEKIDFSKGWTQGQPAFYAYDFTVEEPKDTYLDLSEFGKGVAFVNGQNLGRFWNVGPTLSLYIPHSYLKEGANRIIIFETEGQYKEEIHLTRKPTLKHIKGENL